jgi:hypothetical protein
MKASILAGFIVLVALAGFAQTPSGTPASPAVVQSPFTAAQAPSAPEGAVFAANRQVPPKSTCTASCGGSSTVNCSGTTCSAVDRNCGAFERGHATCTTGGTTTTVNCPTCNCESVCVCGVPCSTECVVGSFVQECGSWGICATSCACGGECRLGSPRPSKPPLTAPGPGNACASLTQDELLSKIFR